MCTLPIVCGFLNNLNDETLYIYALCAFYVFTFTKVANEKCGTSSITG